MYPTYAVCCHISLPFFWGKYQKNIYTVIILWIYVDVYDVLSNNKFPRYKMLLYCIMYTKHACIYDYKIILFIYLFRSYELPILLIANVII